MNNNYKEQKDTPVDNDTCCIDYESEYYRQDEIICSLVEENERLKQALINVCLRFGE